MYITGGAPPSHVLIREHQRPRAAPKFAEWLMEPSGRWVTAEHHRFTMNQQVEALGNGVPPLQAAPRQLAPIVDHSRN